MKAIDVLREIAASRTEPACEIARAEYALRAIQGWHLNSLRWLSGLKMRELKIRLAWMNSCFAELAAPSLDIKKIRAIIHKALRDKPRCGAPAAFTAEQVAAIIKIACEQPKTYGLPFSRWNHELLRETVIAQKIVADISASHIGKILRRAEVKPHRSKYWLNSADRGTPEFEPRCKEVIKLYAEAGELAKQGVNVVCCDEKTGTQALERNAPDKPTAPGQTTKLEYEYTRHGTLCLIAGLMVATGAICSHTIGKTRTERDFAEFIRLTVATKPQEKWVFIVDQLNTHKSESLCLLVMEMERLELSPEEIGVKGKSGILKDLESRMAFLENSERRIRFQYTPKHCSWLNQIECWFGILQRHALCRASFENLEELQERLEGYIAYHNKRAQPYDWSSSSSRLLKKPA
ncbi:MAG: hypothetical protein RL095_2422 [Verrucomicrobiota bacterium]